MTKPHLLALMLLTLGAPAVAEADTKPVKAEIVDVPAERRDWGESIGNVKVTFADGRKEMWTKKGKALHPKVSPTGIVGWTRYTNRNSYGEPVNDKLRLLLSEKDIRDFKAFPGPFIEAWDFADHDTAVVIMSRSRHGPESFVKYDIKSGKVLDAAGVKYPDKALPDWAKALLE